MLKLEVLKWANTLEVNSLECQYKLEYDCSRDVCTNGEVEEHYESNVFFRYKHPDQYVKIERIQPLGNVYTRVEVAIVGGEISKRCDFNGAFKIGFVKSPEIKDLSTIHLSILPTEFFETEDARFTSMEEFIANGIATVYERNGFLILSHQSDSPWEGSSIDFYFDDKMHMRRLETSSRPSLKAGGETYFDPELFYKTWDADPFEARALFSTMEFDSHIEDNGILFPIQITRKHWDIIDPTHAAQLRLVMNDTAKSDQERAKAWCEFFKLPKKAGLVFKVSIEQIALNAPLEKSNFLVEFPPGAYVADWSTNRVYAPPQAASPFQLRMTAKNLSAIAAFISVALAVAGFLLWLQRRKAHSVK